MDIQATPGEADDTNHARGRAHRHPHAPRARSRTIRARLLADRKTARTLRLPRSRQLASARKTLLAAGTATLTLKVSKKARRRFARLRNATTTLKVTVIGADKKSTTLTRSLRLRR